MKHLWLVFFLLFAMGTKAQKVNKELFDTQVNGNVMIGYCNKTGFESGCFAPYFTPEYEKYKPRKRFIKKLTPLMEEFEFTVVLGTWCGDSREWVPRFYKILAETGYSDKKVKAIGVNREKLAIILDISDLDIERVPTFIIYKNGTEIGRIIESPDKRLEKDLWRLLSQHQ